jgi:GTP pyrophosphokinase
MRDWISVPKSNGYESLHATVVVPGGKWVEVQIRTNRMDEIAEKGLAAHWKYKGQKGDSGIDDWLNKVREVLETADSDSQHLIEDVRLNLYANEIFVFTPKGDLKKLPLGATILDFAYEIHSNVGDACTGGRVNGKNVPIRHQLNNGDKVEIITSKNQRPKPDWIDFVVTSKAKAKIKLSLKENMLNDAEQGKEIFQRRLRNWKIPFSDTLVTRLLKYFKLKNAVDFYFKISTEEIDLTAYKSLITSNEKDEGGGVEKIGETPVEKLIPALARSEEMLIIDEKMLNNVDYKLAKCCNPIFGDEVFGFVTVSEGIKIHRVSCSNASQMTDRYGYRVIKARWAGSDSKTLFPSGIKISGNNDIGLLGKITDVISKDLKVNLRSVNVDTSEGAFEGIITVFIKDKSHLDILVHKLAKIKGVSSAHRTDSY